MSQELKREYLRAIRERYQKSPRVRKSVILEEFVTVCGYSRKYAIRILNGDVEPLEKKHRGRVVKYSGEVVYHCCVPPHRRQFSGVESQHGDDTFKGSSPSTVTTLSKG